MTIRVNLRAFLEMIRAGLVKIVINRGRVRSLKRLRNLCALTLVQLTVGTFSSDCFAGQKLQIEKKTSFSRSRIRQ